MGPQTGAPTAPSGASANDCSFVARTSTVSQQAHFHAQGWTVIEGVFPVVQMRELAELSGELAAAQLDDALNKLMGAEGLSEAEARKLLGAAASGDAGALSKVQGLVGANTNASGQNKASPVPFDPDFSPDDRSRLAPRKLDNPYGLDERYRAIVHDRALHQLAWELLGGARPPQLWGSQLFMKPPEIGSTKPYHQDVRQCTWPKFSSRAGN
jgi:hypothetical protein